MDDSTHKWIDGWMDDILTNGKTDEGPDGWISGWLDDI